MFDGQLCVLVAIAIQLAIALAALLVEDEHLVALHERTENFAYYFCSFNSGSADSDGAIVHEQHLVEFNSLAAFCALNVVHEELLAFFHLELLTVNLYDCVHLLLMC